MIFDNTIDDLLLEANRYEQLNKYKPAFISDWNPANDNIIDVQFKTKIENTSINNYNYLYSIDDIKYKDKFRTFCSKKLYECNSFDFSLFSNSTLALYLVFKSLKMHSQNNVLVFTPCYFTSESALLSLGLNIFFTCPSNNTIDKTGLISLIKEKRIDSILITDPIYGMGLSIKNETYNEIIEIAKEYNVTLIVDYSYGNMVWNELEHIFNYNLVSILANSGINYFIVDSLPKKLFLNGVKFSLLFSNPENVAYLENLSLFIEGSMTAEQFKNYYHCYNEKNSIIINSIINDYIRQSQNTYKLIHSFLLDSKTLKILYADSGIFALIGMRRSKPIEEDMNFAKLLIKECGVFVTPHSRYKFFDNSWFYFRINLLLNKDTLIESLAKISSL